MPKGCRARRYNPDGGHGSNKRQNTFVMVDELTLAKMREAANELMQMTVPANPYGPVIFIHPNQTFEAVVTQWSDFGEKWICPEFESDSVHGLCINCGDPKAAHIKFQDPWEATAKALSSVHDEKTFTVVPIDMAAIEAKVLSSTGWDLTD